MSEEKPKQLPVNETTVRPAFGESKQEVQIQAPSLLEKIQAQKKKVLIGLGSFLGALALVGLIFGAYKLGRIQQEREQARSRAEVEELTRCDTSKDCVIAIRIDQCCNCPKAISRQALGKDENLVEYELGRDYSEEIKVDCQNVICKPCGLFPPKAVCLNGICTMLQGEVTPTPDATADWETYTNTKYGYSIKYPEGWTILEGATAIFHPPGKTEIEPFFILEIDVRENPTYLAPKAWFEKEYARLWEANISVSFKEVEVGELKGEEVTFALADTPFRYILIGQRDKIYFINLIETSEIGSKEHEETFNLILSTFKFLEKEKTGGYQLFGWFIKEASDDDFKTLEEAILRYLTSPIGIMESFPPQFQIMTPDNESCKEVRKILPSFDFIGSFGECIKRETPVNPEEPVESPISPGE